jgi:NAD(P)-dependent dehydrogenase (short-subunit alcohol dehydrogenase family)
MNHLPFRVLIFSALSLGAITPSMGADAQKAVLVTGASTGIGRSITERLSAAGYFVYAGARKDVDLKALGALRNVQAVRLDVTRPEDITAAVNTITQAGRGLYGLVNNAGIGTLQPIVAGEEQEFERAMLVNVFGPYRVTRAFAPLIIASKGRITTIGSISGILAVKTSGAYSMSKHAMEAFTDSLAQEMGRLGVQVSIIEPGNFSTQIAKNALGRTKSDLHSADRSMFPPPDDVAAAVQDALFAPYPKRRYLVVSSEPEADATIRKQVQQLIELNEGQRYTYDRTALVQRLDEALEGSRPRTPGTHSSVTPPAAFR